MHYTKSWLVVSTQLKNIRQIGSSSQVGVKIKDIWVATTKLLCLTTCAIKINHSCRLRVKLPFETTTQKSDKPFPFTKGTCVENCTEPWKPVIVIVGLMPFVGSKSLKSFTSQIILLNPPQLTELIQLKFRAMFFFCEGWWFPKRFPLVCWKDPKIVLRIVHVPFFLAVSLFIPMRSQLKALLRNTRLTKKYSFRNSSSLQKMV